MNRTQTLRGLAPAALFAASALLLAGCAGQAGETDATGTPSSGDCLDIAAGAASDGVEVSGGFGELEPEAAFSTPLAVEAIERTVVDAGDGEVTAQGDSVTSVVSIFNGASGELIDSQEIPVPVGDAQVPEAYAAGVDCMAVGSRVVTVIPAVDLVGPEGNPELGLTAEDALVFVTDVVEIVPPLEPQAWTENVPEVAFGDDGAPTVTIPDADPSAAFELAVLKEGDGDVVGAGDTVTLNYHGIDWATGDVFDSSWDRGEPATFSTSAVIPGFAASLVGQKVGSQVIATIPSEHGYDDGMTRVFLIDIIETAPAG